MLVRITRTSGYCDEDKPPCEGAFWGLEPRTFRVDRRSIDDPSKFPMKRDQETWYTEGRNHRVDNGEICRDIDMTESQRRCWMIELPALTADFSKWMQANGGSFVYQAGKDGELDRLEIYDDWRE